MRDVYFKVISKLHKNIKVTKERWDLIAKTKHPIIEGKENEIKSCLADPDELRKSISDPRVHLYYKKSGKYHLCSVIKHSNGEGFMITAYITDRIKEGKIYYHKR